MIPKILGTRNKSCFNIIPQIHINFANMCFIGDITYMIADMLKGILKYQLILVHKINYPTTDYV